MFTGMDKALIAGVMAIIYLINTLTSFHIGFTEEQVTSVIMVLTPILVWLVPNKAKP